MTQNQEDISQIVQESQKNQRWMMISMGFQSFCSVFLFGLTIWANRKKKQPSHAVLLLRKKGQIAKLKLELETLEREAKHETELTEFTAGLKRKEEKEIISSNFITDLKNKGTEQIKDRMNKLKDKFPNPLEKKS